MVIAKVEGKAVTPEGTLSWITETYRRRKLVKNE